MSPSLPNNAVHFPFRRDENGVALVATLAMLTIVSVLLVVFVVASRLDHLATASYGQSVRVDVIGQGALQMIVGQLIGEMNCDGSTPSTVNGKSIYTNLYGTNMVPQRVGADLAMINLVKISTNLPFYSGVRNSSLNGTTNNSILASLNGRTVSADRWNQIYLGTFTATTPTPCWVLVTRGGLTNAAGILAGGSAFSSSNSTALNNPAPANDNYAIGRIAYAIYDEGGLLDINAAGYPDSFTDGSSLDATESSYVKGTLAGADVTLAALGINRSDLMRWRNGFGSGQSKTTYVNYINQFVGANGFGKVYPRDNTFLSRQDLIQAAKKGLAGITSTVSLQNLGTFTRELAAPSWGPRTNGISSSINYASLAVTAGSTNRLTALVRFPVDADVTSYRSDTTGTSYSYAVKEGAPLLQHRFPLDRIKWLTPIGPANASLSGPIKATFGLAFDSTNGVWRYVGSTSTGTAQSDERSSIDTLDEVAAQKREPNFFELLQAGIYHGSLGVTAGNNAGGYFPTIHNAETAFQIFRIGASIIDQYDTDSYPTVIEYKYSASSFWQAVGIENLPYLNAFKVVAGLSPDSPPTPQRAMAIYILFSLWNPHQPPYPPSTQQPRFRVCMGGALEFKSLWADYPGGSTHSFPISSTLSPFILSNDKVNTFANPSLLNETHVASALTEGDPLAEMWAKTQFNGSDGEGAPPTTPNAIGYRLPDFKMIRTGRTGGSSSDWTALMVYFRDFSYWLEYERPNGGGWMPYNYGSGINDPATRWNSAKPLSKSAGKINGTSSNPVPLSTAYKQGPILLTSDPRSTRFGIWQFNRPLTAAEAPITALWSPSIPSGYHPLGYGGTAVQIMTSSSYFGGNYFPALLSRNSGVYSASNTSYLDRDGVQRIADSGLFPAVGTAIPTGGNPFLDAGARKSDRPVVLNRPFASVAEMGYAFRDAPWRTLDFFTANSADSGLLDLFSLSEESMTSVSATVSKPPVIAGRLNLNTQNVTVLQAVLSGTTADEVTGAKLGGGSSSTINAMAQAIVDQTKRSSTTGGPLGNKSELVTRVLPALTSTCFSGSDEENIKARREAMVRTLASVGQTRTWNLLIDLVAQSGKYPSSAKSLTQFIVEGERRYWLHVAIDRVTGEVVDQQLEIVNQE